MSRHIHSFLSRLPLVQQLGLERLIGLAAAVGCLIVFGVIAENVVEQDQFVTVDVAVANALHAAATPTSTAFYRVMSFIGMQGLWIIGGIMAVFFISRRQWIHLGVWVAALAGGTLLNNILKSFFARPRPVFMDPLALAQNYSFPSGHAMTSLIVLGMVTFFLWSSIRNHISRIFLVFTATLLIVLVGISRIALGLHYVSDVIAGYAAGGLWLITCIITLSTLYRRKRAGDPAAAREKTPES